jgi:P4 family phage/plasmid primase-like protien
MRERDYNAAVDFLTALFGDAADHNFELRSLPNDRGNGLPKSVFTRDPDKIIAHCVRRDEDGRGMFVGMATRLPDRRSGTRADVSELGHLWVDIDTGKLGLDPQVVVDKMKSLPLPPTAIVSSGGGLHGYWKLREPLDVRQGIDGAGDLEDRVVAVLRQLAGVLAGDIAVCDLARVLRLPGTMNTKPGIGKLVEEIYADWTRTYEFEEIEDWLSWQRPLVDLPKSDTDGKDVPEDDLYMAAAKKYGWKPPIDVQDRLTRMRLGGDGDASIHQTQLHCSAAMVAHGYADDLIVEMLLARTREAAGWVGERWNWRREEQEIRKMIAGARAKGFARKREQETTEEAEPKKEATNDGPADNVSDLGAARQKKHEREERAKAQAQAQPGGAKQEKVSKDEKIEQVAGAVIGKWTGERGPLLSTEGALWTYSDATGIWRPVEGGLKAALEVEISTMASTMKAGRNVQFLNSVYTAIVRTRAIFVENVAWNDSGLIVGQNGAIDPRTRAIVPHVEDHYATHRIEATIDPKADCPQWIEFLRANFTGPEQQAIIDTLAEYFGASLIRGKTRELRKALIVHGLTRTGKTQLANVLRAVVGGNTCGMRARDLDDKFGMQPLIGASGWIADDAVSTGEFLDAERFKVIVTGEQVSIQRKNMTNWDGCLDLPVCLTANHLPRVRDQSDAVYNRALVLPMNKTWHEATAGERSPSSIIIETELGGVVNWALDGLARLLARRHYDPPPVMAAANREFRANNAPVPSWMERSVEACEFFMVDRRDIVASFNGWRMEEDGAEARLVGGRWLIPEIRKAMPGIGDHGGGGRGRFLTGLRLTEEGIRYVRELEAHFFGKKVSSGSTDSAINRTFYKDKPDDRASDKPEDDNRYRTEF